MKNVVHNAVDRGPVGGRVAVVIINYNGWEDTLAAYESVGRSSYKDCFPVVLDNGSTDGSAVKLRSAIRQDCLLESPINTGFAGGCNRAMEHAIAVGCDYIFLLNPDATVEKDAIDRLVKTSRRLLDEAILGCAVKFAGTVDKFQFIGSQTRPETGLPAWFNADECRHLLNHPLIESDFVLGAALFVPARIVFRIGNFDEAFFLNFEEVDFCYRARKEGVLSFVVSDAVAHHRAGGSLGSNTGPLQSYFLSRNEMLLAKKHSSFLQRLGLYARRLRATWDLVKPSIQGPHPLSPSAKAMLLAIRDYVFRRFGDCPPAVRRYAIHVRNSDGASG